MRRASGILLTALLVSVPALAQPSSSDQSSSNQPGANQSSSSQAPSSQPQAAPSPQIVPPNQAPPRTKEEEKAEQEKSRERSAEAGESSSRDTQIDTTPPKDDVKNHPNSKVGPSNPDEDSTDDVQEVHPWNPYRAVKDDEVGEFYYKRGDYKGALARYQDALIYKPNDAVANFHLAQCYEKMKQPEEAIPHYQEYLRILPRGPLAKDARKALAKLGAPEKPASAKITSQESTSRPE
jgi:tetratricopeptide (TPR) repeat protein